jgi:hypothetical protein
VRGPSRSIGAQRELVLGGGLLPAANRCSDHLPRPAPLSKQRAM